MTVSEQAERLLQSPNIVPVQNAAAAEPVCNCKCDCGKQAEERIRAQVKADFNKTLALYFAPSGSFNAQLETLLENKITEMFSNTSNITAANNSCIVSPETPNAEKD